MATFQVSKEYVRGQLMSMGIQNVSEEDLEAYTRGKYGLIYAIPNIIILLSILFSDFSRLVDGHLEQEDSTSSNESNTPQDPASLHQYRPKTRGAPSSARSSTQHTPVNPSIPHQKPSSAVFKVSFFYP